MYSSTNGSYCMNTDKHFLLRSTGSGLLSSLWKTIPCVHSTHERESMGERRMSAGRFGEWTGYEGERTTTYAEEEYKQQYSHTEHLHERVEE